MTPMILATAEHKGWLAENGTLLVGVVGILVSGLVGPSIAARWTTMREREKDARARLAAHQDDLRIVVDEAAKALGGAVARLRPALEAQLRGEPIPADTRDFLAELFTLGQRLRIRAPAADPLVRAYDAARDQLKVLSRATGSKADFDGAADVFDDRRAAFLDASRDALTAPTPARK